MTTLTLDVIRQAALLLEEAKPLPQLFSYSMWPTGEATVIEHEEGQRIVANPDFWARIPLSHSATVDPTLIGFPHFMGLRVIDLDLAANKHLRRDVMLDMAARLSRVTSATKPAQTRP